MSKGITEEVMDYLKRGYTVKQVEEITGWNKEWIQMVKDKMEVDK